MLGLHALPPGSMLPEQHLTEGEWGERRWSESVRLSYIYAPILGMWPSFPSHILCSRTERWAHVNDKASSRTGVEMRCSYGPFAAAVVTGSWLSIGKLNMLLWSGGKVARVDSVDALYSEACTFEKGSISWSLSKRRSRITREFSVPTRFDTLIWYLRHLCRR